MANLCVCLRHSFALSLDTGSSSTAECTEQTNDAKAKGKVKSVSLALFSHCCCCGDAANSQCVYYSSSGSHCDAINGNTVAILGNKVRVTVGWLVRGSRGVAQHNERKKPESIH